MENFTRFDTLQDGLSGLFVGPADWARAEALRANSIFLSTEQLAAQRLELGPYHQISWTGSRVTDSYLYWEHCSFLCRDRNISPLYDSFSAEHHFLGEEMPFDGYVDGHDFIMIPSEDFDLPTDGLRENEIARFLLGEQVESYAAWLEDCKIPALPVTLPPRSLLRLHTEAFIRPLVMRCTDNWSGLVAASDLHHPYGVRSWLPSLPAGGALEPEEVFSKLDLEPLRIFLALDHRAYTLRELEAYLRSIDLLNVLGPVLRLLRGGSTLPVSHQTFAPNREE